MYQKLLWWTKSSPSCIPFILYPSVTVCFGQILPLIHRRSANRSVFLNPAWTLLQALVTYPTFSSMSPSSSKVYLLIFQDQRWRHARWRDSAAGKINRSKNWKKSLLTPCEVLLTFLENTQPHLELTVSCQVQQAYLTRGYKLLRHRSRPRYRSGQGFQPLKALPRKGNSPKEVMTWSMSYRPFTLIDIQGELRQHH